MKNTTPPKDPRLVELDGHYARLLEHLENNDGHDQSVPGANRDGHFAVLTESLRGFGGTLVRCSSREDAQRVAADAIYAQHEPIALYDLRIIDGDPPELGEGDTVRYRDEVFHVIHVEEQAVDAVIARYLLIAKDPDAHYDAWDERVDEDDEGLEVVERAEDDERQPRRYPVADVTIHVAFNVEA